MATHHTKHDITVEAEPGAVFDLIADVAGWPQVFGPTVHVDLLDDDGARQLLHIWALANGEVRDWTSRRTLDRAGGGVEFRQVVSSPPVASMGGRWSVERLGGGARCAVTLTHDFEAIADDPDAVAFIQQAVDRNSNAELAALKTAAEQETSFDGGLRLTFSDAVSVKGAAAQVFEFINRADLWPERLPHVSRIDLVERVPGVQRMTMDTRSPDGSVHTTESVRLCFPERNMIVYKQLQLPPVMTAHTGRWELTESADGLVARSWHTVTLNPAGVREALGAEATVEQAREKVRHALGTNSLTTLRHAKQHVESGLD